MAQETNPFMLDIGKTDISPILQGIGSLVKQSRDKRKNKEGMEALKKAYGSNDADEVASLIAERPDLLPQFNEMAKFRDESTKKNYADSVRSLAGTRDPQQRADILAKRIYSVDEAGGDSTDSQNALRQLFEDPKGFESSLATDFAYTQSPQAYKEFVRQRGGGGAKNSVKSFAPVTLVNKDTGEKMLVAPIVNQGSGATQLSPFDIPEGFGISKETDEEKRNANVLAKGREVMAKGEASRAQSKIDDGYSAANAIPEVNRAIQLLESVETGGIDNLALRAKQLFGVEGADEGELSQLMGKAVLKQLKPTFGAAFTKNEGDKLERLEASFGRNPKTNLRLLKNALKIYTQATNNAIKRARKAGDSDTVRELEEAMAFNLSGDQDPISSSPPSTSDLSQYTTEQLIQMRDHAQ